MFIRSNHRVADAIPTLEGVEKLNRTHFRAIPSRLVYHVQFGSAPYNPPKQPKQFAISNMALRQNGLPLETFAFCCAVKSRAVWVAGEER